MSHPRYEYTEVRKYSTLGEISARSTPTVHRGVPNRWHIACPVLMLGVDAPDGRDAEHHDLAVTRTFQQRLPAQEVEHLSCPVVDQLTPITQRHSVQGLDMGEG